MDKELRELLELSGLNSPISESVDKDGEIKEEGDDSRYDDCWDGYKRVPGKKKDEKGSCTKEGWNDRNPDEYERITGDSYDSDEPIVFDKDVRDTAHQSEIYSLDNLLSDMGIPELSDEDMDYLHSRLSDANGISGDPEDGVIFDKDMIATELKNMGISEEVIGDLNNGYHDQHSTTKNHSDYFPTGAHGNVVKRVGPSGARHGDNPMQKVMQDDQIEETAKIHKELVYAYRDYLSESLSISELRKGFWRDHPEYTELHNTKKSQSDYPSEVQSAWGIYVQECADKGIISTELAERATL